MISNRMSHRLFALVSLLALLALLLAACSSAASPSPAAQQATAAPAAKPTAAPAASAQLYDAAKKEGKIVLYTDQVQERIQALINAFKTKYPGIDVDFVRTDSASTMERIISEAAANRNTADIYTLAFRQADTLAGKGLVMPYTSPEAPAYPADLRVAGDKFLVYSLNLATMAYNTQLVKADAAPKTWADAVDPKWAGKVGLQDPLRGGGIYSWISMMYKILGEEKWTDYMKKLAAQKPKYDTYMAVQDMLASGEIGVMVAAYPDYIEPLKVKGAPVDWTTADPMMVSQLVIGVLKAAPHPNAGKLFVDFMLSAETQKMTGDLGMLPARPGSRPGAFARVDQAKLELNPYDLQVSKKDFFDAKVKEFFGH